MTILDSRQPHDERRERRRLLQAEQLTAAFYGGNPFTDIPGLTPQAQEAVGYSQSFETVSKNQSSEGATLAYNGAGDLASITYANGVIKTFIYSGGNLTSIVLSGAIPPGIDTTKTLTYTGDDLTDISYS